MIAALIILAALIGVGGALYLYDRLTRHRLTPEEAEPRELKPSGCCGMHLTCEADSLSTAVSPEIVYYDDEELDLFANRQPQSYTPAESEAFREILLTMRPEDIAGWARSLQLRQIDLPSDVKEELLLIVAEARRERENGRK